MSPRARTRAAGEPLMLAALALSVAAGPGAVAQSVEPEWNGARALELVERARTLRRSTVVDSSLRSYQAEARGYVYFFIDRPDSDERSLIKADQIALDVFWQAPNRTKQRIVGLRDEKVLPTNIRYHLDHLTVVQDDFGELIRLGDGDEVSAVPHPIGEHGPEVYDFQLADSLSLRYGGGTEEVRVYEVRVRPKDPDRPGVIGTVFLDRGTSAIVRMGLTFTPASYVDPHLDYIRISLDNSMWEGRYWLPYRQEVELRRELPILDFLVGSIIRGRFEIGGYRFNPTLDPNLFLGTHVASVPEPQREAFPFERGLYADLDKEGLSPAPALEDIRERARQVLAKEVLSGLAPVRLHIPAVSDVFRYDRAEGVFVGGGIRLRPTPDAALRVSGGWAFGPGTPSARVSAAAEPAQITPTFEGYWNDPRDIGPLPGAAGAVRTLGAVLAGEDYQDPFFARGIALTFEGPQPGAGLSLTLRWEENRSARNTSIGDVRPLRQVHEGFVGSVGLRAPFPLPGPGQGRVTSKLGRLGDRTFVTTVGSAHWGLTPPERRWRASFQAEGGWASRSTPAQQLFLIGGRGTLPGYGFRRWAGRAFALARLESTTRVIGPWLGLRTFLAVGGTYLADRSDVPPEWGTEHSGGLRASVGVGVSLGWDVLRLDLARGLRDGKWEISFSIDPRFEPWL